MSLTPLQNLLCLCIAAYGLHVLEEFVLDWRGWARGVLGLPARWEDFYVTNMLVVVLGAVAVAIAPAWPAVSLGFAGLILINATLFHVAPFLWTRGRFSPGLITAVLLMCPAAIASFRCVSLVVEDVLKAFLIGAALMLTPVAFLKARAHRYFDQQGSDQPSRN